MCYVAVFLQVKYSFRQKRPFCVFEPPLGAYRQHMLFILGSFVMTELFSLDIKAETLRAKID